MVGGGRGVRPAAGEVAGAVDGADIVRAEEWIGGEEVLCGRRRSKGSRQHRDNATR